MVITLGSASKALAPGLRIGWIVADERIVQRLADVKMQMDYGASTLSQWVFARFLSSGLYDEYMVSLRMQLRLTFDEPVRTGRLFQRAIEHGVLLNPGDIYDFEGDNSLRLSYSYTTPEEFAAAAETLASLV